MCGPGYLKYLKAISDITFKIILNQVHLDNIIFGVHIFYALLHVLSLWIHLYTWHTPLIFYVSKYKSNILILYIIENMHMFGLNFKAEACIESTYLQTELSLLIYLIHLILGTSKFCFKAIRTPPWSTLFRFSDFMNRNTGMWHHQR